MMAETAHCAICLGFGAMDIDTGRPWTPGRRPGARERCETCKGYGQFTDCPPAESAARVAHYIAERHPFMGTES